MAAEAETLNCPMCGAPASSDATLCEHCGARLATVACPSCFGLVFAGAKFCSHCGAAVARADAPETVNELCPRCGTGLDAVVIGKTNLHECPRCEGIWADTAALQQICTDREQQAAVIGTAAPLPQDNTLEIPVRYLKCPVCRILMNRVNFARCSHVIVDVCKAHGTWFDKDELRRIVEFIRAGGMDMARAQEIADLQRQKSELRAAQISAGSGAGWDSPESLRGSNYGDWGAGLSSVAGFLMSLLD